MGKLDCIVKYPLLSKMEKKTLQKLTSETGARPLSKLGDLTVCSGSALKLSGITHRVVSDTAVLYSSPHIYSFPPFCSNHVKTLQTPKKQSEPYDHIPGHQATAAKGTKLIVWHSKTKLINRV